MSARVKTVMVIMVVLAFWMGVAEASWTKVNGGNPPR